MPLVGVGIVNFAEVGSTNPEMLKLLTDMSRSDVWESFLEKYSPLIRCYCDQKRLTTEESTEIYSRVIFILVSTFADPNKRVRVSFRGYLRKIISTEIGRLLREKQQDLTINNSNEALLNALISCRFDYSREMEEFEQRLIWRLEVLSVIFETVKQRVQKQTWQLFWDVTVKGKEYDEVSKQRGINYVTVVKSNNRVIDMIQLEALKNDLFRE